MIENDWFPRTVRPRKNLNLSKYPLYSCCNGTVCDESGNTYNYSGLYRKLPRLSPSCFILRSSADFLAELDKQFSHDPTWNWRCTSTEREIITESREVVAARMTVTVQFFGWRDPTKRGNNRYHLMLDPVTFYGRSLDEVWPGTEPVITRLMAWGKQVQEWCYENNYTLKPTNGAIGSQFLRDPRFYSVSRRKVPKETNEQARPNLPGNHYQLHSDQRKSDLQGIYLDQRRAHHYHARTTRLPCCNSLFAYGDFINLENHCFDSPIPNFSGLYFLSLNSPKVSPPFESDTTIDKVTKTAWVWSNELEYLTDMGFSVKHIIAAWGSKQTDNGIPRYAEWSEQQLDLYNDAAWLKPILLCTYGLLAVKPRTLGSVFKQAKRGEPAMLFTGHNRLHGLLVQATSGRKIEPGFANVIHRGLIESATRVESLSLANYLVRQGHNVLSIYADAVIVEKDDDKELPPEIFLDPWRRKTDLTHLQFINQQAFVSGEMTKLPGLCGNGRDIINASRGTMGKAPNKILYNMPMGTPFVSERKI